MKIQYRKYIVCHIFRGYVFIPSLGDSIVYDITTDEAEDEGAGCQEVEDGDLDLANCEGEAQHH